MFGNSKKIRKCEPKIFGRYSVLEDRRLLAVSTSLESGTLSVFGDAAANTVNIQVVGSSLNISGDLTAQYDVADVSLIRFFGGAGDDFFESLASIDTIASGHEGSDTLRTGGGSDQLYGGEGDDDLVSGAGDDRIVGQDGADTLSGGVGDDVIYGLQGNDTLYGNDGDDTLVAGFGDDIVYGGAGEDLVYGHFGDDMIFGGADNDRLFGQDDNDTIHGDDGDDTVRGGFGSDTLFGDLGDDRVLGDQEADTVNGGEGNDIQYGGPGNDILLGGAGNDLLFAGDGDDDVQGQAGNDILRGHDGNDTLSGGDNADRIAGDAGDDYIDGGSANDTVLGDAGADTIVADSNDHATGGAGDDILQLSGLNSDIANYLGNYANFVVTQSSDALVIRDTTGAEGQDRVTGADSLQFADGARAAAAEVTQRVFVQPIVASDNNGSNTAVFFGDSAQEFDIKRRIDEIYLQAGIDVEWLDAKSTNNTFFNFGNGTGTRPQNDIFEIVDQGDSSGVGSQDPLVIDMYLVNRVPGFQALSANSANGLAFIGAIGTTIHVGDNLVDFSGGRAVIARVTAHELAHNLGLHHVNDSSNLMDDGTGLYPSQITTIRSSSISQNI